MRKLKLPSPAMAVALVALFVALSGTAFAVGGAIDPGVAQSRPHLVARRGPDPIV